MESLSNRGGGRQVMANAISWIAKRAKALKRLHPNKHRKYSGYIQDASAEYRRKHKPGKSKRVHRAKKIRRIKKRVTMKRTTIRRSVSVGSLTAAQHVSRAKDLIAQKIANLELRKFTSRTKAEKRKISRAIRDLKRSYSKLKS